MKIRAFGIKATLLTLLTLLLPLQAMAQTAFVFNVTKEYTDTNLTEVFVRLDCEQVNLVGDTALAGFPDSGTTSNLAISLQNQDPFGGGSCTVVEDPVPTGYTESYSDGCTAGAPIGGAGANEGLTTDCTITNTQDPVTFTVSKTFDDGNDAASVNVALDCGDGVGVVTDKGTAELGSDATFTVSNFAFDGSTTCTATESEVPAGYTPVSPTCASSVLLATGGSCGLRNEQDPVTVTVYKAYTESHPTADLQVAITLTCPTGTVDGGTTSKITTTTGTGMNRKAEFVVSDFPFTGENCTATEAVPAGYKFVSSPGCDALQVIPGGTAPTCTFTNRPTYALLMVDKIFSDGNPDLAVTVTPSCTDAGGGPGITYTPASGQATQGENFNTTVKYFAGAMSCKATEVDPVGYTQVLAQSTCNSGVAIADTLDNTCTIYNQQDPVTIVASKAYGADGGPAATFAAACDGPNTKVAPAGGSASAGNPLSIVVSDFPWNGTHCNVTEPVPPSGYYETDSSCNGLTIVPSDNDTLCAITNAPTIARFQVNKNFMDGNHNTPVDVTLSCFTGLPLVQTQSITESQGVNFVVEDFDHLQLDCSVTEEPLPGYAAEYIASGLGASGNVGGCQYENVGGGEQNFCQVDNYAIPVDVVIEKVWVIEGSGGDFVDTRYKLALRCDGEIAKGEPCDGNPMGLDAADNHLSTDWCRNFKSDTDNEWIAKVTPRYPATTCTVTETIFDNAVETDMGECPEMVIKANQGASCLVTNTVFFEGIPTLSQYGLAILALLMLGVGMVGFRRFA